MDSIQNLFEINDGVCLTTMVLLILKAAACLSLVHVSLSKIELTSTLFLAGY